MSLYEKTMVNKPDIRKYLKSANMFSYYRKPTVQIDTGTIKDLSEIDSELRYHMKNNSYTSLLRGQIKELYENKYVKIDNKYIPFNINQVYWTIEDEVNGSPKGTPLNRASSRVGKLGLLHVHHNQSMFIVENAIRYLNQNYKKSSKINKELLALKREYNKSDPETLNIFMNSIILESTRMENKTGEWLIYKKGEKNRFHFICLYHHNYEDKNDLKLYELIKNYI